MARLSIEQFKAPDLSVASEALRNAGSALTEGMTGAQALLSKYQEGLEATGDAELTNLLAGAKNEDEWGSILATTDFSKMNLSAAMRNEILNRRDSILGYEQARADTNLTNADIGLRGAQTRNTDASAAQTYNQIGLANNADRRYEDLHGYRMQDERWAAGARAESAANAPAALEAALSGLNGGYGGGPQAIPGMGPGPGTNLGPRADGTGLYSPEMGTPNQIKWRNGIAAIESDGSGGYEAIGATDPKLGRALGRYQIMEANIPQWSREALGREVSVDEFMKDSSIQDAIFDNQFGKYVGKYGEEGAAQAWFGGEGGVGKTDRTDVHGRLNIGTYGSNFVNNIGGSTQPNARSRVTTNPNAPTPQQQQYFEQLAKNTQFSSTSDLLAAMEAQYNYNDLGQAAITAADAKVAEEAQAQLILDLQQQTVTGEDAIVLSETLNKGATAVERLQNYAAVRAATGDGGALDAAQLTIGLTGNPREQIGIAEQAINDIRENQNRDRFQVAAIAAEEFVDDPAGMMVSALEGLDISVTPADVESAINSLMKSEGITRAQAAYSYARAAESEPRIFRALSIGGDNLSNNAAKAYAREHFKGDNAAQARNSLADSRRQAEDIQLVMTRMEKINNQIQKAKRNGDTPDPAKLLELEQYKTELLRLSQLYRDELTKEEEPTIVPSTTGASTGSRGRAANRPTNMGTVTPAVRLEEALR